MITRDTRTEAISRLVINAGNVSLIRHGINQRSTAMPKRAPIHPPRERLRRIPMNRRNAVKPQQILKACSEDLLTSDVRKSAQARAIGKMSDR